MGRMDNLYQILWMRNTNSITKLHATATWKWWSHLGVGRCCWLEHLGKVEHGQFYGDSEVLFYRGYVDDTFCLFHSEQDAIFFFNYINNQHPNIRFTMEWETDHVLPFRDVLISNTDPHLSETTVYRKKNFTGLLTSYLSFSPFAYKLGLIKTLIDRTSKIKNHLTVFPHWPPKIVCYSTEESLL